MRTLARSFGLAVLLTTLAPGQALAGFDLYLFLGRAYPGIDDRLRFDIPAPSIPGVNVSVAGAPEIKADGGLTFGGAIAIEAGVVALEGRLDAINLAFDVTGARFDLMGVNPPLSGLTGRMTLADGRLDLQRLNVLSLNLRVRTPGPIGVVASGGISYLPGLTIDGTVPVAVVVDTPLGELAATPRLGLEVSPDEEMSRVGLNAGAGLRIGAGPVAIVGEARAFLFREYALRFTTSGDGGVIEDLASSFAQVRVRPLIVTAQAGLLIRF